MLRLSIIIPIYGVEKYISRCLESVLSINLSESDYEVICVDDCSRDQSVQIIEEYQSQHSNIRLLHHTENKRQGGARNTGVQAAEGEFVIFVDGDDRLPDYNLAEKLDYMQLNRLELLLGTAEIYKQNGTVLHWGTALKEASAIMSGPEVFVKEYIHEIAFGVVWIGIYNTSLLKRIEPFKEYVYYEDADWTLRCAYEAKSLQYIPDVVYHYLENGGSTTKLGSIDKLIDRVRQGLRVWDWAQTTTIRHDEVVTAAEDFCTWNLHCLKSLGFYGFADRRRFFRSFSEEEYSIMKQWTMGGKWMDVIRKPLLSKVRLTLVSPILRFGKYIKKTVFV